MRFRPGPDRDPFDPVDTLPLLRGQRPMPVLFSVAVAIAVPIGLVVLLLLAGEPALRVQYWYRGSAAQPVFERCIYFGLSGARDVRPVTTALGRADCPLIVFFPPVPIAELLP